MKTGNYNCFSYNQMKFLVKGGEEPIHAMNHSTTGNRFWVFERNENLDILLNDYSRGTNKDK